MARGGEELNRWWVVLGAVLGLTVGNGPIMQFSFGVFLKPVAADFGTDRGTLSLAVLLGFSLTGLATPVVGALIDRYGVRRVILPGIVAFALMLCLLGWLPNSASSFVALYAVMGVFAAAQTPLPYAKAVAAAFERHRGLALGIAMSGIGVGTAVMPQLAQALITAVGWRAAYAAIGLIMFVVAMPCMAFLVGDPGRDKILSTTTLDGTTGRQALSTDAFWILALAFFALAFTCAGVIAHIAALLTDRGIAPQTAAAALGLSGVALIAGRLLAGYLLDRIFAPYVATVFYLLPLVGLGLFFLEGSTAAAVAGTVLVGLGLGAEVDMIAFLISRYFGMRAFGQIYGYLFAVFMIASGLGPFVMGLTFTRTGSYAPALVGMGVGLVTASVLLLRLGPYRFTVHGAVAPASGRTAAGQPSPAG